MFGEAGRGLRQAPPEFGRVKVIERHRFMPEALDQANALFLAELALAPHLNKRLRLLVSSDAIVLRCVEVTVEQPADGRMHLMPGFVERLRQSGAAADRVQEILGRPPGCFSTRPELVVMVKIRTQM